MKDEGGKLLEKTSRPVEDGVAGKRIGVEYGYFGE